ncbi:hypothetical protein SAMN05421823_10221 [Catalinimonas alkaloidigena]|uniref:Uncharacterized protein n=2 Tax=Catalinimonas alkaloidigena TaxID=1075417 RepID=A0A1G8ZL12_9BACT|nr:hypothetical protein SAMN05421823_10221 [Catalinimonas alkaloidigena]
MAGVAVMHRLLPTQVRLFSRLFTGQMVGLMLLTLPYALVQTRGITVMLLLMPLLVLALRQGRWRRGREVTALPWGKVMLYLLGTASVFFLWQSLFLFDFARGIYRLLDADNTVYDNLVYGLNATGQENYHGLANRLEPALQGTSFYHWFEVWMAAGIVRLWDVPASLATNLFVLSGIQAVAFTGLLAMGQVLTPLKGPALGLIAFGLLWLSGAFFSFYAYHPFLDTMRHVTDLNPMWSIGLKVGPHYLFALLAWLAWHHRQPRLTVLALLGGAIVSALMLPALLGGLVLVWWQAGRPRWLLADLLLTIGGLAIFYGLTATSVPAVAAVHELGGPAGLSFAALAVRRLKDAVLFLGWLPFRMVLGYALWLVVLWKGILHNTRREAASGQWLLAVSLAGGIAAFLWADNPSAGQLLLHPVCVFLNLNLSGVVWQQLASAPRPAIARLQRVGISVLLLYGGCRAAERQQEIFQAGDTYGAAYRQWVEQLPAEEAAHPVGVYLPGRQELDDRMFQNAGLVATSRVITYAPVIEGLIPVMPRPGAGSERYASMFARTHQSNLFARFCAGRATSDCLIEFLRHYRINVVIIGEGGEGGQVLTPYIQDEKRDARSGERFIRLNPWP